MVPSRLLLEQFAPDFPDFCKVGTGYNHNIRKKAPGFVAVSDSVHLLADIQFEAIIVDEAHHSLPATLPEGRDLYLFSATHQAETDFQYGMGQAITEGVLCDYDLTVPVVTVDHHLQSLATLLKSNPTHFRRVLAYCNSVNEAKRVQRTFEMVGLAAWHMNANTRRARRQALIEEFSGEMQKPVHVLVTVQVLGEGVNIPNADTCMFVQPRSSYTSIIQAIGRVLRKHASKPLAHIILPAVSMPSESPDPGEHGAIPQSPNIHIGDVNHPPSDQHKPSSIRSRDGFPQRVKAQDLALPPTRPEAHSTTPCRKTDGRCRFKVAASNAQRNYGKQLPSKVSPHLGNIVAPKPVTLADTDVCKRNESHLLLLETIIGKSGTRATRLTRKGKQVRIAKRFQSLSGDVYDSQLERFISAIAHADASLAASSSSLHFRLCFADCRTTRAENLHFLTRALLSDLTFLLQTRDPWEARLQQLESFVTEHGRIPYFTDRGRESLFCWVKNTGVAFKTGKMPPSRVERLLRSHLEPIRKHVLSWQDPNFRFRNMCERLRAYVCQHQAVPKTPGNLGVEGNALAVWLQSQRRTVLLSRTRKKTHRNMRKTLLEEIHPLVYEYVQTWRKPRAPRARQDKDTRMLELLNFVNRTGRLPISHRSMDENRLYQRSLRLRQRLPWMPSEERAGVLLSAHPILIDFLKQA